MKRMVREATGFIVDLRHNGGPELVGLSWAACGIGDVGS